HAVPETLPEDLVVEEELLIVREPRERAWLERRPRLHRQRRVPQQGQDAVEEEDRERGREERPDEDRPPRPPCRDRALSGPAAGSPSARPRRVPPRPACVRARPPGTPSRTPPLSARPCRAAMARR